LSSARRRCGSCAREAHQEKPNVRWGNSLFLGLRRESGELIAVDEEAKKIEHVRAVDRGELVLGASGPVEHRWRRPGS
jgi:hypothetical protein